jgi:hypothetical protein
MRQYRCTKIVSDKYGAQWTVEAFAKAEARYEQSELDRSAIYMNTLPIFTSAVRGLIDKSKDGFAICHIGGRLYSRQAPGRHSAITAASNKSRESHVDKSSRHLDRYSAPYLSGSSANARQIWRHVLQPENRKQAAFSYAFFIRKRGSSLCLFIGYRKLWVRDFIVRHVCRAASMSEGVRNIVLLSLV